MPRYGYGAARGGTHQTLLTMIRSGGRVLDIGCASGHLGRELIAKGAEVWGIEVDPASGEAARAVGYADVLLADLDTVDELPWGIQTYDVVIVADVLEHVKGPGRVLSLIRDKWLAPRGEVLVSLPNVANFTTRLGLLAGRFNYTETGILDDTHLRLYTYATSRDLLIAQRFRIADERAGSDRFGVYLNGSLPGHRALRGLLAFNIILKAEADGTGPSSAGSSAVPVLPR